MLTRVRWSRQNSGRSWSGSQEVNLRTEWVWEQVKSGSQKVRQGAESESKPEGTAKWFGLRLSPVAQTYPVPAQELIWGKWRFS